MLKFEMSMSWLSLLFLVPVASKTPEGYENALTGGKFSQQTFRKTCENQKG